VTRRRLVVNADDFGLSPGVNRGIAEAHDHGILTSTSLMVRPAAAQDAVEIARARPRLGVGIHVHLGEWMFEGGSWRERDAVVDVGDPDAIEREVEEQLARFIELMDGPPTHVDTHQHVHRRGPARSVLVALARRLGVPLRENTPGISYCGAFYGQTSEGGPLPTSISVESLLCLLRAIPPGLTELGCHPGYVDERLEVYAVERELELAALCDPAVRHAIAEEDIELCSFRDVVADT